MSLLDMFAALGLAGGVVLGLYMIFEEGKKTGALVLAGSALGLGFWIGIAAALHGWGAA